MTPADRAHQVPAIVGAVVATITAGATVVAAFINLFGAHITGMDVTAKTSVVSAAVALFSKGIDSVNNALRNRPVAPMASAAPASMLPAPPDAAVIRAIGQSLANYGSTPSTPPKI